MSNGMKPMDEGTIDKKNESLTFILQELSDKTIDSDSEFEDYIRKLSAVYDDDYRQMYSRIHPVIILIYKQDEVGLDFLMNNLEEIRKFVAEKIIQSESDNTPNPLYTKLLYGKIFKLSDHVSIECQRIINSEEVDSAL